MSLDNEMGSSGKVSKEGNSRRKCLAKDFEMSVITDFFEEDKLCRDKKKIMIKYKLLIYTDSISRGAGIVSKGARILFEDIGELIEDFMWEINKSKFYFNDVSLFEV